MVKLFSKNSNLCDHHSPTSQRDRQTTYDRNTALCTEVHRAVKMKTVGHYVNTTVEHYDNVFVHKGGKLEKRKFLAKMHQTDCTKLRLKFQNFPWGDTWGGDTPSRPLPYSPLRSLDGPLRVSYSP